MNKDEYTYPRDAAIADTDAEDAFELSQTEAQAMHENMDQVDIRHELEVVRQRVDALDEILADHINGISRWAQEASDGLNAQRADLDQLLAAINEVEAKAGLIPVSPDLIQQALLDANEDESNDVDDLIEAIVQFALERQLNFVPVPHEAGDYPTLLVHAALRRIERGLAEHHQNMLPSMGHFVPVRRMLAIVRSAMPGDAES